MAETATHIGDLRPDPRNARKHTPRNVGMIESSIQRDGFGRSVLLARDGTIIAGNATVDAAMSAGLEDVIVIETDGTKIVAVKRTDVAPDSPEFRNLALSDNRAAELAEWDADVLRSLAEEVDLSAFWFEPELDRLLSDLSDAEPFDPAAEWQGMPEFHQDDQMPVKQVTVNFGSETDLEAFGRLIEQNLTMATKSVWYPVRTRRDLHGSVYTVDDDDES